MTPGEEKKPLAVSAISPVGYLEEPDRRLSKRSEFTMSVEEAEDVPEKEEVGAGCRAIREFPVSIWFIFLNELCERFSFYGMKAILTLYFTNVLLWSDDTAITAYHTFSMMCYLTPILGAIIADTWWGKYKTIIVFSLVYALGHVVKSISTIPVWFNHTEMAAGTILGLALIALGTGGIKPCVCSFGGDQIPEDKPLLKDMFFSVFYVSINIGAFVSMVVTPILREDVQCFDKDCYTLAFGVPAVLFIVATCLFVAGTPLYKNMKVVGESMIVRACGAIASAFRNRFSEGKKFDTFIYHASPMYEKSFLDELIQLGRIFVMTLPTALFFMGFDQQGSTWTIQAQQMDGNLGFITLYPDQMQFINSLLVIILVPVTYNVIYPLLHKCHLLKTRLQKMGAGMVLACCAFILAAFLQFKIDTTLPFDRLTSSQSSVWAVNTLPCGFDVQFFEDGDFVSESEVLPHDLIRFSYGSSKDITLELTPEPTCAEYFDLPESGNYSISKTDSSGETTAYFYLYSEHGKLTHTEQSKSEESSSTSFDCYFSFFSSSTTNNTYFFVSDEEYVVEAKSRVLSDKEGNKGSQNVSVTLGNAADEDVVAETVFKAKYGGIYLLTLTQNLTDKNSPEDSVWVVQVFPVLEAEMVNILWQVPQYVVITFAEVLVSVTGLDFAYSESGAGVKACAQAIWLLGDAIGNFMDIVLFSAVLGQMQTVYQFFVNAGIIAAGAITFMILACFYKPYIPKSRTGSVYNEIMESNLVTTDDLNKQENPNDNAKPLSVSGQSEF